MKWWNKIKSWCVVHWRWLLFSVASIATFLLGYSKARKWQIKATDVKKNFDKEREIIETLGQQQIEENLAHVEARDKAHENNALVFEEKLKELKTAKREEILKDSKDNLNVIDDFLENQGIEEE